MIDRNICSTLAILIIWHQELIFFQKFFYVDWQKNSLIKTSQNKHILYVLHTNIYGHMYTYACI